MNETTLNLFSLGEDLSTEELKEGFLKIEETAHGNPAFAFSMVVDKEYLPLPIQAESAHLRSDVPLLLASYLGPVKDAGNPLIQLYCLGLVKEIAAEAWLKDYLNRDGTEILEVQAHSPLHASAAVHRTTEAGPRLALRMDAQIHGNRLFLIQCTCPADQYEEYVDRFGVAIASFKPLHEMAHPSVEVRSNFHLDGTVHFSAPFSWPFKEMEAPPGMEGVSLFNLDGSGNPAGALKVFTLRRSLTEGKSDLDLPALMVAEFTKNGLEIVALASEDILPVRPPLSGGSIKVLTARIAGEPKLYNILVALLDAPDHHVMVGLLTCAPKEDFYLHSVNMRAFEIVLETLEVGASE